MQMSGLLSIRFRCQTFQQSDSVATFRDSFWKRSLADNVMSAAFFCFAG